MPVFNSATLYAGDLMTIEFKSYIKHYFAEGDRLLSNVAGGGKPLIDPLKELKSIIKNAKWFSEEYTKFVSLYFNKTANAQDCSENGIEYPADMKRFPPLVDVYIYSLQQYVPDKLYYFHANHLGSGSLITDENGRTYQTLAYAPFGETLIDIKNGTYDERYKFGGKEKDDESGMNYFEARYYSSNYSVFISTDPMWAKYPGLSSYNYCGNNPIMFIDPNGEDIKVHYTDAEGNAQTWVFNGKNATDAPDDQFVQDFLTAYNYDVSNGGGESIKEAATNSNLTIGLRQGNGKDDTSFFDLYGTKDVVWFSHTAVETTDDYVMSPATVLDHEFGHAVGYFKNPKAFMQRFTWKGREAEMKDPNKYWEVMKSYSDKDYGNKEERRVITSTEARTAQANGEYPAGYVRPNHYTGGHRTVSTPTSTGTNVKAQMRKNGIKRR
jgi:RHS repeat-associated protein